MIGRRSLVVTTSSDGKQFTISSSVPQQIDNPAEELLPTGFFALKFDTLSKDKIGIMDCYRFSPFSDAIEAKASIPKCLVNAFSQSLKETSLQNPLGLNTDIELLPDFSKDQLLKEIAEQFKEIKEDDIDHQVVRSVFELVKTAFPTIETLVDEFIAVLKQAVSIRCSSLPANCSCCAWSKLPRCSHAKFAMLFSGGIDSTLLTSLVDQVLISRDYDIDLLNVMFFADGKSHENGPDRKTALEVLEKVPVSTKIQLRCINIAQSVLEEHRKKRISHLILPCETILDDSLGSALWFACQGKFDNGQSSCSGKILFHGLGADELFAGYSKHRAAFT